MEEAFFATAKQAGLTDEEAKSAFNSNMMSTGLLSEFPTEFAREHGRRWMVSAYEAGDAVLHKPHMVIFLFFTWKACFYWPFAQDPCFHYQQWSG